MPVLLVVDDEPSILHAFRRVFRDTELKVLAAENASYGLQLTREQKPDVVILDVNLPDMSGLDLLDRIRTIDAKVPVIFITGHGTTETAIEATKRGAFDYLFKPLELPEVRKVVQNAFTIARMQNVPAVAADEQEDQAAADVIVGRSPLMNDVYKAIGRAAPQDVTVLITGESGTGKELVARAVYHHSRRSSGTFLAINCAAIPEALLESELFGHEQGAFTGADRLRVGKFEQCTGGTLFLDEVGDMSPTTQAKILRVLEEQRFERVGGNETIQVDVRLIAATNRELQQLVAAGSFREDLYFRLRVFSIHLPPLRERNEDLLVLVRHFLKRFGQELGKDVVEISPDAMQILTNYSWPGNVRELQSILKQALLHTVGSVLLADFLPDYVRNWKSPSCGTQRDCSFESHCWDEFIEGRIREGSHDLYSESTLLTDRHLLMRVLRHTRGNQLQAARILGISRATLRNKLKSVGVVVEDIRW